MVIIPKYLQVKFKKTTNIIKPEHKKFVDNEVNYILENNYKETGARYNSEVGGEYRAFKTNGNVYIAIAPNNYYIIQLNHV
jgi:hypothetical protein